MAEDNENWLDHLRREIRSLPPEYAARRQRLLDLRTAFHLEVARAFEVALGDELATLPQGTHEERRDLASWVNRQTRELGLSVASPKSGGPVTVVAGYRDDANSSRFQLVERTPDGHRRSTATPRLAGLKLCQDPTRREAATERFDRSRGPAGRGG